MQRKFLIFFFAVLLVAPMSGWALGLGKATVKSSLNQPLLAEIPILSARARELDVMTVKLAPPEMFERANVKRSLFLSQLKFELIKDTTPPVVRITSRTNITEPFVTLILELNWANGRIMREFTLMLDPPRGVPMPRGRDQVARRLPSTGRITAAKKPVQPPASDFAARPTTRAGSRLGTDYGTVRSGQTLWQIANEVKGNESMTTEQLVMALYRTNPEAFSEQNINALLAGRRLRVPSADEVGQQNAQKASAEFREQVRAWRRGVAMAKAEGAPKTAAQRAAQAAQAAQSKGAGQAAAPSAGQQAPTAAPAKPKTDASKAARPEDTQVGPRLQVLAPSETGGAAGASESSQALPDDVDALKSALIQAQDETDRARVEREQQTSRMQAMQDRLSLLERLVTLKDQELATLQQQSAVSRGLVVSDDGKEQEEPESTVTTPATAATKPQEKAVTPAPVEDSAQLATPSPAVSPRVIGEDPSAVNFIWSSPKVWFIALTILFLVFLLIWIFVRSMLGTEEPYEESDLAEKLDRMSAKAAEMEKLTAQAEEVEKEDGVDFFADVSSKPDKGKTKPELPAYKGENPFMRGRSATTATAVSASATTLGGGAELSETEMDDVLKEVNVFLNYGRQDHALNFLVKLTESYPDEVKPRVALLKLSSQMKREDLFAEQAQALWDRLDDRTGPEWLEVAALGRKFLPDHPLFSVSSPYDSAIDDEYSSDQPEILTFDLPGEARQEKVSSPSAKANPVLFGEDSFEFDDSLFSDELVTDVPKSTSMFDAAAEVDSEFDAATKKDTIETRLELAKNYIEMGDVDGAIEIIKYVLKSGTPKQVDEASRLLLSLDVS